MFDLELTGDTHMIRRDSLASLGELPREYVELLATWGPGLARGRIAFPDPTALDGMFALMQKRFRVLAPQMRAIGRWSILDDAAIERGIVIAHRRDGLVVFAKGSELWGLLPRGGVQRFWAFESLFREDRRESSLAAETYTTEHAPPRAELFAALAHGDEATADRLLAETFATESAWAVLEIAHVLAFDDSPAITRELRAQYFGNCIRLAKRVDEHARDLPVRAIVAELASGALAAEHAAMIRELAYVEDPFAGPADAIERQLLDELVATPDDRGAAIVLADHLETRGQLLRASLVRGSDEALSKPPVDTSRPTIVAWTLAWTTADPDAPLSELTSAIEPLSAQRRDEIVDAIRARKPAALAGDDAVPLLVLALRSPHVAPVLDTVVTARRIAVAPWLLRAIRRPTYLQENEYRGFQTQPKWPAPTSSVHGIDWRECLALAHHELAKVSASELDEIIGWYESPDDSRLRVAAACLAQAYGANERVFVAALARFAEGHPYTEKTIARRKTDPRVQPALLAAFDRAEDRSLIDGRHVAYTREYRVLSKYLTKLGNARGKDAWERCKKMDRVDRAASERAARRDGI